MGYSLADLTTPPDEPTTLSALLATLTGLGFPVTSWFSGGVGRTLVQAFARYETDVLALLSNVTRGGLLDLAPGIDPGSPGDWLTPLALSAYQLTRVPAQFGVVRIRLACSSLAGPYTITPGQLWAASPSALRYNSANTANVVVPSNGSVDVDFRAESPGAAYALGLGLVLPLLTPLPGVTATTVETSGGSGTCMTAAATDAESDTALRARCRTRWATIGLQKTGAAYAQLACDPASGASSPPTRVYVDDTNPRGAGTVDVWIAGADGPLSGPDEALVRAYVLARKSPTADLRVQNATAVPVTVAATLYARGNASAAADATARLTALINALPLGGTLYRAAVIEQLMLVSGAVNTVLATPGADVALAANQVATVGAPIIAVVTVP